LVLPFSGLKNKRPVAVLKTPRQAWPKPNEVSHIAQVNSDNSTPMPAVSTWRRFLSQAAGVAASLTLRWPTGGLRSFSAGGFGCTNKRRPSGLGGTLRAVWRVSPCMTMLLPY
jgi:hypothetical protein